MAGARISLCIIAGNEAATITRFLDSFKEAFDELCIVRAVGNQDPDSTLGIAHDWCRKHGKKFVAGVYENGRGSGASASDGPTAGSTVVEDDPRSWPHVDDFAAARNVAWSMASCPWQLWADVDDVLVAEAKAVRQKSGEVVTMTGAALIRLCAAAGDRYDRFFFTYDLRHQQESIVRERLFKTGTARWVQPLHETCQENRPLRTCIEPGVIYEHAPTSEKNRDPMRNRRIMEYYLRYLNAFPYELCREWFYDWQALGEKLKGESGKLKDRATELEAELAEAREKATKWGEIAYQTELPAPQRFDLLLKQACMAGERDIDHAIDLCWSAIRIDPMNRAAWFDLAEYELRAKRAGRAAVATSLMQVMPKKGADGFPQSGRAHGWEGLHLRLRSLRAAGKEAAARKAEDEVFAANGRRISLLHATRGRPAQALITRSLWLRAALVPLGVEHIFAIDADDAESLEALKDYRHVVVTEPNGCVRAWNAAAAESSGHVLVQLSDDWVPCHDWDQLIWEALEVAAEKRQTTRGETIEHRPCLQFEPLVLAVHDGHRTDALLCMAILTRTRYLQQKEYTALGEVDTVLVGPYLFSPEYFGVFSDNEFTVRAYDDGVVVQAQHIVFQHNHPVFGKAPMDATYARQNAPERYPEGLAIFNRRNPKHAIPPSPEATARQAKPAGV